MDLKKNLEDDPIFCGNPKIGQMLNCLHDKGIYTIEDYMNCSILNIKSPRARAFDRILRYKYLDEPLPMAPLLDREFSRDLVYPIKSTINSEIIDIFDNLGFIRYSVFGLCDSLIDRARNCGSAKIIDVIKNMSTSFGQEGLKSFYISYYNIMMKKDSENCIEKKKLIELKDELLHVKTEIEKLTKRREELDAKIVELQDENNVLEKKIENKYSI